MINRLSQMKRRKLYTLLFMGTLWVFAAFGRWTLSVTEEREKDKMKKKMKKKDWFGGILEVKCPRSSSSLTERITQENRLW